MEGGREGRNEGGKERGREGERKERRTEEWKEGEKEEGMHTCTTWGDRIFTKHISNKGLMSTICKEVFRINKKIVEKLRTPLSGKALTWHK